MRKLLFTSVILTLLASFPVLAQEVTPKPSGAFTFSASYVGDLVSNFKGGIKKGTNYLGLANLKIGFNTDAAKAWKGGEAFINIGNTHGGEPSKNLVGDLMGLSNIEAGNLTFLYELWYKQNFGKVNITLGLQDLNADFVVSEYGKLFTNSSFGIHSSIADNIPSPIFPLTALGANVQWDITDDYLLKAAIFDGTPDNFEVNPYNIRWKLSKNEGFFAVTEFQLKKSLIKAKPGCYKFGTYYHEHKDEIDIEKRNRGFYFVGDQTLTKQLSAFSQIGLSPKTINKHNHYYSLGLNYKGLLKFRNNDETGIALAYAGVDGNVIGSETTIELTYLYRINKNIYIRPDIQYIINPAGTTNKLDNALVGFIRIGIDL